MKVVACLLFTFTTKVEAYNDSRYGELRLLRELADIDYEIRLLDDLSRSLKVAGKKKARSRILVEDDYEPTLLN